MKEYILFDLDGTLTDPGEGIANSIEYSLKKLDIPIKDRSVLYKFVGPPLLVSYEKYFGLKEETARSAVQYYREYYEDKGIFENVLYDGIKDLLAFLKSQSRVIILATAKPTIFAERILKHFEIYDYFDFISGSELDGTRVNKDEVIEYAIKNFPVAKTEKAVMIGDRENDIIGARKNNIASIGILYGYGDFEELNAAKADYIVKDVIALRSFLIEN